MTHAPTSTGAPHHTPTTCWCCGRHAHGIGLKGFGRSGNDDPHWLCQQCILILEHIKAVTKWDLYEQRAISASVEAAGPLIEKFGTDLADWSEEQAEEFAATIILGFGDSIRKQVTDGEVPF